MKRLIALSIAFALVAAAAFAEVSVGGSVVGNWEVVSGDDKEDSKLQTKWGMAPSKSALAPVRSRVNVTATNEDGNFGGWIQLRPGEPYHYLSNIWWQPLDVMKITLGYFWGGGNPNVGVITFNDDILPPRMYGRNGWKGDNYRGILNGWGYEVCSGTSLELFPIENLYIAVTVPTKEGGDIAEHVFAHTMGRVAYTITDIGQLVLSFAGGTGKLDSSDSVLVKPDTFIKGVLSPFDGLAGDSNRVALGFTLTAVENLGLYAGFEMPFVSTEEFVTEKVEYQPAMEASLRANFKAGAFNVAGGVLFSVGQKATWKPDSGDSYSIDGGMAIGATINPSYDLGIVILGFLGEFKYTSESKREHVVWNSYVEYNIMPYIQKNVGGGAVYAAFQIGSDVSADGTKVDGSDLKFKNKTHMSWSIPVGFEYWF
ncbi:MAG: hypothetical protein LBR47_05095 [Spirochaetaceae bacterium]|nr:hypothetical protein [Spirochaetaceae bacterium]